MTGLVLKLRPAERVLINGVVIENGDRRSRLNVLTADAHILRLRDALHPSEVTTPVSRVCYVAQLVLAGEADPEEGQGQLLSGIQQLMPAFVGGTGSALCADALVSARQGRTYQALKALKALRLVEAELLQRPA